jgi:hypothetical protein
LEFEAPGGNFEESVKLFAKFTPIIGRKRMKFVDLATRGRVNSKRVVVNPGRLFSALPFPVFQGSVLSPLFSKHVCQVTCVPHFPIEALPRRYTKIGGYPPEIE